MSHVLNKKRSSSVPFTADVEVQHWQMRWIETHPMQKKRISLPFYYANLISVAARTLTLG